MERFAVIYRLSGSAQEVYDKAQDICLEQTVEFPGELLPPGLIQDHVVGRIEGLVPVGPSAYHATISFDLDTTANELTQLLNVVFGNISIKPGYRLEELRLPDSCLGRFRGPRFGRKGLREWVQVEQRPLLFTALKPMGLSARELADLAYRLALGGIDIIKDDHGLTDQVYAPFHERVPLCAEAVERANQETGQRSIYMANVTAPYGQVLERARFARKNGARGLLVAPGLVGFDTMKTLADDDRIGLPIIAHPAWLGSYVLSPEQGVSHYALLGQITRLAGADGSIYPNFGGRFSFSQEECQRIVQGTQVAMGRIKPIFPCPGGGMSISTIPDMIRVYGCDVAFLVGGGLFKHGPDIIENCRYFRSLVDDMESHWA
ncbi:MAG TPA: RuBisCO large subunit C-terminal-like domain-containing protein [Syntrophomonadaceae bacterium]|nr:RuBisCO large subunit C-terminal-like domain-containing protein [Syntrophomonadaceae bacterium]